MISNVANRPNKLAKGLTKHYERRVKMNRGTHVADVVSKLMVRGTTDHLTNKWLYFKKVLVEHPTDKGYFKSVITLTDTGRKRLQTMRQLKKSGLPLWEYMYKSS